MSCLEAQIPPRWNWKLWSPNSFIIWLRLLAKGSIIMPGCQWPNAASSRTEALLLLCQSLVCSVLPEWLPWQWAWPYRGLFPAPCSVTLVNSQGWISQSWVNEAVLGQHFLCSPSSSLQILPAPIWMFASRWWYLSTFAFWPFFPNEVTKFPISMLKKTLDQKINITVSKYQHFLLWYQVTQ